MWNYSSLTESLWWSVLFAPKARQGSPAAPDCHVSSRASWATWSTQGNGDYRSEGSVSFHLEALVGFHERFSYHWLAGSRVPRSLARSVFHYKDSQYSACDCTHRYDLLWGHSEDMPLGQSGKKTHQVESGEIHALTSYAFSHSLVGVTQSMTFSQAATCINVCAQYFCPGKPCCDLMPEFYWGLITQTLSTHQNSGLLEGNQIFTW